MNIRPFQPEDEEALVSLWKRCHLVRPTNDPHKDIQRKLKVRPDLFLVGTIDGTLVASVMAGYEGHRGWLNYLAVDPDYQRRGLGRTIVTEAERLLGESGCPKINLQVLAANHDVLEFYRRIGYSIGDVVSLGKRLEYDDTATPTITIKTDDPSGEIARKLIEELCAELSARYGQPPNPFSPSEAAAERTVFLVAYLGDQPVGCGAIRRLDDGTAEIKRMYVAPAGRRKGIARGILAELEKQAVAFGYKTVRLETGILQPEAQSLYKSLGYQRSSAYGSYVGDPTSICYEKSLNPKAKKK